MMIFRETDPSSANVFLVFNVKMTRKRLKHCSFVSSFTMPGPFQEIFVVCQRNHATSQTDCDKNFIE